MDTDTHLCTWWCFLIAKKKLNTSPFCWNRTFGPTPTGTLLGQKIRDHALLDFFPVPFLIQFYNHRLSPQFTKHSQTERNQMASIYSCKECGTNLNLNTSHLYPATVYFPAGNKGTLSFAMIDSTKFRLEKEDKIRPFFETLDYWGIQRKRTKIKCNNCGALLGYIYDDGPPAVDTPGQFHFGPSQVIPRYPRYRLKTKALRISTET
ncbi:hypothetical protein CICLE_v10026501mg [Citrus x clementina]|uniref:Uncharacterized protein n=3 Tax=Citrus TaxID=2706 RepID=V4UGY8_CITCL|nr:hypothetical protein CICLE_v10026501mg [Citrus x clementina]